MLQLYDVIEYAQVMQSKQYPLLHAMECVDMMRQLLTVVIDNGPLAGLGRFVSKLAQQIKQASHAIVFLLSNHRCNHP